MGYNDMKPIERLAVAQALYKELGKVVGTKSTDNLRAEVDEYYIGRYLEDGMRTANVRLNGQTVGTFSVISKKIPAHVEVYQLDDKTFADWVQDDDAAANACIAWMLADQKRRDAFARYCCEVVGVVPDGYEAYREEEDESITTRFSKLDVSKVAEALGEALPSTVAGLLTGAE